MADKVIITCALSGAVTMPVQSPYLPLTPEQMVEEAVKAAEAGAASVHIHARSPENGKPTSDANVYRQMLPKIKERSNVIINITTGGGLHLTPEQRISVVPTFKPEIATFNMGSMNFSIHPLAKRYKDSDYKYDWEKPYIEMTEDIIFRNTFADLRLFCKTMKENNSRPEAECYDTGHIYNCAFLVREGLIDKPVWLQFVTGVLGGIGSHPEDILAMKRTADRLNGAENYMWSVIGCGFPHQFNAAALAVMLGGNIRVGLEDNIFIEKGVLAKSNADLVAKAVRIVKELGKEVATPDEARKILGLKGKDKVGY